MPTENAETPKNDFDLKSFGEKFDKKMEELTDGLSGIRKTTTDLEDKVTKIGTRQEPRKEPEDDIDDDLFDTDRKVEKKVEERITKFKTELETEQAKTEKYAEDCQYWDAKTDQKFTDLNGRPMLANADFSKEVDQEIQRTTKPIGETKGGKKLFAPDAVYKATASVFAEWVKNGKLNSDLGEPEPEPLDGGPFNRQVKGKEVNDIQMSIAARLGIKADRAKEIYKGFVPGTRYRRK